MFGEESIRNRKPNTRDGQSTDKRAEIYRRSFRIVHISFLPKFKFMEAAILFT